MNPQLQQFAKDVVEYIEMTQGLLEKSASADPSQYLGTENYRIKLAEAVESLAENRLIPLNARREVFDEFLSRPEKIAETLCKLSQKVGPHSLGEASERTDVSTLDPILRFVLS